MILYDPTYMVPPLRSNQMAGGERQERQYEQRLQEAEQQLRVQAQVFILTISSTTIWGSIW